MKEKKLMTIMIGMRRTGDIMQSDEEDDEKFVPITFEEACDEFTDMHDKAGTLPDGDDIDENIEWGTNQLEYAHQAVEIEHYSVSTPKFSFARSPKNKSPLRRWIHSPETQH